MYELERFYKAQEYDYKAALSEIRKAGKSFTTLNVNLYPQVGTNNTNTPQTVDNSSIALWIELLLANGCLLAVTVIYGKKKKYNR